MSGVYDNAYSPTNVYGRALDLLRRHRATAPTSADGTAPASAETEAVHLDIACGYGAIADYVEDELGLTYVGLDVDEHALAALTDSGKETHPIDLSHTDGLEERLRDVLGGRHLASITFLDGLEHLTNGPEVLRVLSALVGSTRAVLVLSVPNVTHRDVVFKAAFGSWSVMPTGLLDRTHFAYYSREQLRATLAAAGLHPIDENNVEQSQSDQHFPLTHPVLAGNTTVSQLLTRLRADAESSGRVQQFVWATLAGPRSEPVDAPGPVNGFEAATRAAAAMPFLTVVIRTQGRRIQELTEAFLSLMAQTSQDFEVLVIAHKVSVTKQLAIEQVIADLPADMRQRVRLRVVDHGTRATLLNLGFEDAQGRYVAVFDDDDVLFAHWVSALESLAATHDGMILRSLAGNQLVRRVSVHGVTGIRSSGPIETPYDPEFSFVRHISENHSPLMTLAFPIGLSRDMGLRFDESMTTTEDWDFLLRGAQIAGVADSLEFTAIYHKWQEEESSQTEHDAEVWRLNQLAIDRKIDSAPVLLQAGETREIRNLVRALHVQQHAYVPGGGLDDRATALRKLDLMLGSRSWRMSAPLRLPARLAGRGPGPTLAQFARSPVEDIQAAIGAVEHSRSWRVTRWVRDLNGHG